MVYDPVCLKRLIGWFELEEDIALETGGYIYPILKELVTYEAKRIDVVDLHLYGRLTKLTLFFR
jgi:hypothetical protein